MNTDRIVAIAGFGCGGLCFLSFGGLLFIPVVIAWSFRRGAIRGSGVIVGYDTDERSESPTLFHPHVRYTDSAGTEHTATARGTDRQVFAPGQAVEILYSPGYPGRVEVVGIDGYREMRLFGFLSALTGVACVLMAAAIWWFRIPVNGQR